MGEMEPYIITMTPAIDPPHSPFETALRHRCPRCGTGSLYKGYLTIRSECPQCGLDYTGHDVGDGPAFFTLTILGFVVVAFAAMMETVFRMPYWLNMIVSVALLAVMTPLLLRWFKSYLIALKYKLHWQQENLEK